MSKSKLSLSDAKLTKLTEDYVNDPVGISFNNVVRLYTGMVPANCSVSEDGIHCSVNEEHNELICNTFVIPIAIINEHSLDDTDQKVKLIAFRQGERLQETTISIEQFDQGKWIRKTWGFKTQIFNTPINATELIIGIVNKLIVKLKTVSKFNYVGWELSDNPSYYITNDSLIGDKNKSDFVINDHLKDFNLEKNKKETQVNYNFVLDKLLKVADPAVTYPALAYNLLSLTSSLFKNRATRPDFIFYLYGRSGSRKTTLAKLLFNIYSGYKEHVPINFSATYPAMEALMVKFRDSTLIIDDIAPAVSANEARAYKEKLEKLTRAYGDNIGRQTKYTTTDVTPQGLCAITAEELIITNKSSLARCFIAPIKRDDVNLEMLTKVQEKSDRYSSAIVDYLEYIANNTTQYTITIEKRFQEFKKELMSRYPSIHGRCLNTSSWLMSSMELFLDYGVHSNFINEKAARLHMETLIISIMEWLNHMNYELSEKKEIDKCIRAIKEMLASKQVSLATIELNGKKQKTKDKHSKIIGFKDKDYIYFLSSVMYKQVNQFYSQLDEDLSLSQRSFIRILNEAGFIESDKNKDRTKTVRINVDGMRQTVLRLPRKKFEQYK